MDRSNDPHRYDDILHLQNPTSPKHPRMPLLDRAAQFSPFAALTGHEAAIRETARLTDRKIELDESEKAVLDAKLQIIEEQIKTQPVITVTYFVPDEKKEGGAYLTKTGAVRRINEYERTVEFIDRESLPIEDLIGISGSLFSEQGF